MMELSRLFAVLMGVSIVVVSVQTAGAVSGGQLDDFQDGTTQSWVEGAISPNPPVNVANGGPQGVGDNYLQNSSSGGVGAGSRQVVFNQVQWSGDYHAAGVRRIEVDMANFGAAVLSMRLAMEGAGSRYGSITAANLPADGQWYSVSFGLDAADLGLISGVASLDTVLSNVGTLRILSAAAGPAWQGDAIASTLGVDNVSASGREIAVPGLGLLGMILLCVFLAGTGLGVATAAGRRLA